MQVQCNCIAKAMQVISKGKESIYNSIYFTIVSYIECGENFVFLLYTRKAMLKKKILFLKIGRFKPFSWLRGISLCFQEESPLYGLKVGKNEK